MSVPTLLPDQPTGFVAVRDDGSFELVLPWAKSITLDEPTCRIGRDPAIPVPIDDDLSMLVPRPILDTPTRALTRLTVSEKLVVFQALVTVLRAVGVDVQVSAMPWHSPEKVHLQAANWRLFVSHLRYQAAVNFVHVRVQVERMVATTAAVRCAVLHGRPDQLPEAPETRVLRAWADVVKNLHCLTEAAPQMERRRIGEALHLPFEAD